MPTFTSGMKLRLLKVSEENIEVYLLLSSYSQASKDAARYPVAAKVAELLVRGIVSQHIAFLLGILCYIIYLGILYYIIQVAL